MELLTRARKINQILQGAKAKSVNYNEIAVTLQDVGQMFRQVMKEITGFSSTKKLRTSNDCDVRGRILLNSGYSIFKKHSKLRY